MLTYNVELIESSPEDKAKIHEVLELNRMAWNILSKTQYEIGSVIKKKQVHDANYKDIRLKYPQIPAQVIIRAENDVAATYRTIKSNKHRLTEAAVKQGLSMRLDKRLYRLEGDGIWLTTTEKRVFLKYRMYKKLAEMFRQYPIGDPLVFIRDGRVFLSIPFKDNNFVGSSEADTAVGIDMGMRNFIATSEGVIYKGGELSSKSRRMARQRKALQKKGTKSARRHLKKLSRKMRNFSKDASYRLVHQVFKEVKGNVIALENLKDIKKNTMTRRSSGKVFKIRWGATPVRTIQAIFEYKAAFYNKKVCYVNPTNTSQIDSRTHKKDGKRDKGRYLGKDGKTLHSDINAAINIAYRSELPLSGDESLRFVALYGQAAVNRPIVYKSLKEKSLDAIQATSL